MFTKQTIHWRLVVVRAEQVPFFSRDLNLLVEINFGKDVYTTAGLHLVFNIYYKLKVKLRFTLEWLSQRCVGGSILIWES